MPDAEMPEIKADIAARRVAFANAIAAKAGISEGSELAAAFASTPREQFVSPPPWKIWNRTETAETWTEDPRLLYRDIVVPLRSEGPLNNGEPSLHALCLAALAPRRGERAIHVGAGTGYYTTMLAKLVGEEGRVDAYEIDAGLAERAAANLAGFSNVEVHAANGTEGPFSPCDVLYGNAGATAPLAVWLDALKTGGRLLFPLTGRGGVGAMLLIAKGPDEAYRARFPIRVAFVDCVGARDEAEEQRLTEAFRRSDWNQVKRLHRDDTPGEGCWCHGSGWWLSTKSE